MPSAGRVCHANGSGTTRSGCSCMRRPATWPRSCAASNDPRRWQTGLRLKLIKIGARAITFQPAEMAVNRRARNIEIGRKRPDPPGSGRFSDHRPTLRQKKLDQLAVKRQATWEMSAGELAEWLDDRDMDHVRGAPYHPQTQGKIERWYQTLKNRILPGDLKGWIGRFIDQYNNHRYHESLQNLTPADVYFGQEHSILQQRERIKHNTINQRCLQHRKCAA